MNHVTTLLHHFAAELGTPFDPHLGGYVFRAIGLRCGLDTKKVSEAARALGYWPWTNAQLNALINPAPEPDAEGE